MSDSATRCRFTCESFDKLLRKAGFVEVYFEARENGSIPETKGLFVFPLPD